MLKKTKVLLVGLLILSGIALACPGPAPGAGNGEGEGESVGTAAPSQGGY